MSSPIKRQFVVARFSKFEFYDMSLAKMLVRLQSLQQKHGDGLMFDWKHEPYEDDPDLVVVHTRVETEQEMHCRLAPFHRIAVDK